MIVGPLNQADVELFARVDRESACVSCEALSVESLDVLTRSHGIDFATAYWYRHITTLRPSRFKLPPHDVDFTNDLPHRVIVIPGAFHRHYHHTGANGQRVIDAARSIGWPAEVLNVRSFGSRDENADFLLNRLAEIQNEPVLLVSLSKGSADVVRAFQIATYKATLKPVRGWLNLSGISSGTKLVDVVCANFLRRWLIKGLLRLKGSSWSSLDELRPSRFEAEICLPEAIRAFHVVGCPLRRHLQHKWAATAYDRLAPLGPNDGGGLLLGQVSRWPGEILPFWGVDHYLNPAFAFDEIVPALLRHATRSAANASAIPAIKSTK